MKLNGQAALVTGGASGLGAATAKALASAKVKVAILDTDIEGAQHIAKEIDGIAIECDVSSEKSGERAIGVAREKHGPARVLINCAGIGPAERIVGKTGPMPLENFRRVIEINLIGSFNLMRLAASDMMSLDPLEDNERGVIISTASVAAFEGQMGQAAYSASKGGVHALTIVGAREFAKQGIRVNTIAPGLINTPMLQGLPDPAKESLANTVLFPRRLGEPQEIARVARMLIENDYMNGETIRMDGGIRMQPK